MQALFKYLNVLLEYIAFTRLLLCVRTYELYGYHNQLHYKKKIVNYNNKVHLRIYNIVFLHKACTYSTTYVVIRFLNRLKSIMLQNFPIILSGTSFFSHLLFPKLCSQFL